MKKILKYIYYKVESINPELAYKIKSILYKKNKENNNNNDITINGCLDNCDYVIDSTQVSRSQFVTGIQRVVINIINNTSNKYLSAKLYNSELITNQNFNNKNVKKHVEKRIILKNTHKLILLDSSWEFKNDFLSIINNNRYKNLKIVSVVYDLIPVKYPHYTINANFQNIFVEWHDMVLEKADHILCISKSVADDVIDYYQSKDFNRMKPLAISFFPLGADMTKKEIKSIKYIRKRLVRFVNKPTFLMVGTIEPRKGHMVALEAFTKLLDKGHDINLLILGREGWKNDDIREFISNSPYNKHNILWIDDSSDYELSWAYQNSSALIAASLDEGYGLPLIEGAHYGIPIICSDIPVFREVSQGHADFFKVFDSDDLVKVVERWLQSEVHPDSRKIRIYTWKEATEIFEDIIEGRQEPYKVLDVK